MKRKWTLAATLLTVAAMTSSAWAHEAGTWVFRAGAGMVDPTQDGLFLQSTELQDGSIVENSYMEPDDAVSLVLSATYMIHDNWAFDILGAWPFEHDAYIVGTLDGSPVSVKAGSVKHLPPTFSFQYHFAPDKAFQPYVGVGLNYTTFFSEGLTQDARDIGFVDYSLADSWGIAGQLGADWVFGDNWLVNFDARYMQIKSKVTVTADLGDPEYFTFKVPGYLEIDPWVLGISIGYRFQ